MNKSQNSLPASPFTNSAENCEEPSILTKRDAFYRDFDHNTDGLHNVSDISANGEMRVYRRNYDTTGQRGYDPSFSQSNDLWDHGERRSRYSVLEPTDPRQTNNSYDYYPSNNSEERLYPEMRPVVHRRRNPAYYSANECVGLDPSFSYWTDEESSYYNGMNSHDSHYSPSYSSHYQRMHDRRCFSLRLDQDVSLNHTSYAPSPHTYRHSLPTTTADRMALFHHIDPMMVSSNTSISTHSYGRRPSSASSASSSHSQSHSQSYARSQSQSHSYSHGRSPPNPHFYSSPGTGYDPISNSTSPPIASTAISSSTSTSTSTNGIVNAPISMVHAVPPPPPYSTSTSIPELIRRGSYMDNPSRNYGSNSGATISSSPLSPPLPPATITTTAAAQSSEGKSKRSHIKGGIPPGENNPNAQPGAKLCFEFMNTGKCQRVQQGGCCRYRHLVPSHPDAIADRYKSGLLSDEEVLKLKLRPCGEHETNPFAPIEAPICFDFLNRGVCSRTQEMKVCRYRHLLPGHPDAIRDRMKSVHSDL